MNKVTNKCNNSVKNVRQGICNSAYKNEKGNFFQLQKISFIIGMIVYNATNSKQSKRDKNSLRLRLRLLQEYKVHVLAHWLIFFHFLIIIKYV